jgi:hypothetical protein
MALSRRQWLGGSTLSAVGVAAALAWRNDGVRALVGWSWSRARGGYTVAERVAQYEADVRARLHPALSGAGLASVPREIALLAFKDSRRLELYARDQAAHPWQHVSTYAVLGASGHPGPKLREGDRQVPEGLYRAERLNPNSRFHLSLGLDYPNAFDRRMAQADGRTQLGGDVMIHGTASSIGCLAIGNQGAEDLFVLAAWVGVDKVRVLISPVDFRRSRTPAPTLPLPWAGNLYDMLRTELSNYPRTA